MPFYPVDPTCQIPDASAKLESLFGRRTLGTFVECGAFDGHSFGGTSALADLGWRGICIEPVPEFALKCALRHANNNVRVFPCAVGAEAGQVDLHLGGTLTTTSARQVEVYEQIPWARGNHRGQVISVPQMRLDVLLEQVQFPKDFDLLAVDVEGCEAEVFAGLNETWRPRVLIVEIEDEHPDLSKFEDLRTKALELRGTLEGRGYRVWWKDAINSVYARADLPSG